MHFQQIVMTMSASGGHQNVEIEWVGCGHVTSQSGSTTFPSSAVRGEAVNDPQLQFAALLCQSTWQKATKRQTKNVVAMP